MKENRENVKMDGFGKRLTGLMEKTHISAYRLAKKLDVHQTTIKNWSEDKNEPKASHILSIAELFNVSCDYLLGRKTDWK